MFLGDLHSHSLCSPDGAYPMLDMARAARAAGLTYLCITDHCDLLDLEGTFTATYAWGPYEAAFQEALDRLPSGLELGRGVELGEAYEDPQAARAILAAQPQLDFVVGSSHNFRRAMGKRDFYNADYTDLSICRLALEDYLDTLCDLARMPDCYDTLAHILYPLRYMRQAGQEVSLDLWDLPERLERVLEGVAGAGKALEVNTWRGRTVAEWEPILRRFKALGGEYVTVGSDAHRTEDVGKGVREAYELLRTCGYRYTAVYKNRKAIMEGI